MQKGDCIFGCKKGKQFKSKLTNHVHVKRVLTYAATEYSFDMEPMENEVGFTILINYIELGVNEDNYVFQLNGFCPHPGWISSEYQVPPSKRSSLQVVDSLAFGFSYKVNKNEWPVYFNKKTGWVCLGDSEKMGVVEKVKFNLKSREIFL